MKLVYIAGPYSGSSSWERELNIRDAESLALKVNGWGHAAICVHAASRYYFGAVPEEHALAADREILSRCDAVLLGPRWDASRGTIMEIGFAMENNIPVFAHEHDCRMWCDGARVSSHETIYGTMGIECVMWKSYTISKERFGL